MEVLEAMKLLGITPSMEKKKAKKAFLAKVAKSHPDAGGSEEEYRVLLEAWSAVEGWYKDPTELDWGTWKVTHKSLFKIRRVKVQ